MDTYKTLNEVLVNLFRDVMDIEQKAIITEEFQDITNNDMHIIEAIGMNEPKNMSTIAREISVTVGTLTIAMKQHCEKRICSSGTWQRGPESGLYFPDGAGQGRLCPSCTVS